MPVEELKLSAEKRPATFEKSAPAAKKNSSRLTGFLLATAGLALCFCVPLYNLLRLAFADSLYSDIPLIPLISLYLIWMRRETLPAKFETSVKPALPFFLAGAAAMAAYWFSAAHHAWTIENALALNLLAFLFFFTGICLLFLGTVFLRAIMFPMAILAFVIPFPNFLRHALETFLQYGSAFFAQIFLQWSPTPVLLEGLDFHLPGCVIEVAPECSGIHSTIVLLIVSLLGGWLFLRSPWSRALLALAVIPLALIRNGFRIFVIGRLCAAYGPQMLASPIHRHGGPLFFALSLIPFFLLLLFLKKIERKKSSSERLL